MSYSVHCASVVRYLVTKGKALGMSLVKAMAIINRYTTDTLPILSWQFTDTLPTHYWCYLDRLLVDLLADTQPTVKHHLTNCQPTQGDANCRPIHHWYLTDTRPTFTGTLLTHYLCYLDWLLVDLSTDTWPTGKRHSADRYRQTLDQHLVNTWST